MMIRSRRPADPARETPAPAADVLAKVGSAEISVDEFTSLAAELRCPDTPEARAALLDEMIEEETQVQRARAAGLDQTPAFRQAMRRYLTSRLDEQELQPLLTNAESISDAELDDACRAAAPRFDTPAARRYAWLRIDTDTAGKETAIARLREATEKFRALPADPTRSGFGTVAAEYSDDTDTRYQGGDLGWHDTSKLPAAMPPAAASLADGELSEPCDVPGGSALFLATGIRNASPIAPEILRSRVRAELIATRRATAAKAWKARLLEAVKVEILRQPPSLPPADTDMSPTPPPLR